MNAEDAGASAASASTAAVATEVSQPSVVEAVQAQQAFDAAKAKTGAPVPGQLDVLAENVEQAAKKTTRSWTSWLTGR
jgi:hypothetical protein